MRLKTLKLVGFKSFADRTRLEFDGGVNVIVGPNGSGKSNLLDAMAWVMGTQATSNLRTQKMEDVIFAGTASRPALNRAEVSLTFDNADRFLPLDLNEVTLTRRLYRDGTSEYEINGAACRLMDLHELLSDGGVGRNQHVLVSQGQIGEILNARPDQHRAVIEEAAGVTKHRSRRDRSVRRLEATDLDIERLNDLLDQERRRLRPLKRQANAAARHDLVKAEVKALRLWLGGEELRRIRERLGTTTVEQARLESEINRDRAELEALEASFDGLRQAASTAGRALERDNAAAARLETVAERLRRIATVAAERRNAMAARVANADERRRDLETEREDLQAQLAASVEELRQAEAVAERAETALRALEDEERALAEQINLPTEGVVANLRGDLRSLESAAERDRREQEALERRRELVAARIADEADEATGLVAQIRETDGLVTEAQRAYQSAKESREAAQAAWEEAEESLNAATVAVASAGARVEAIEASLAGLGDPEASRRAAELDAVDGTLVARLDVPEDLAVAVDAALGAWRDAYVARGPEGLEGAVTALKSAGLGGVAFVTPGSADADLIPARQVAESWGVEALVDRLGPGADRALAARLLRSVVVVEGWMAGWQLVQRHPAIRAVTPEGDVVDIDGIRLANADGAGPAALEAAGVALERAETELARAQSRHTTTKRAFDEARAAEREALERLEALEARLAGHAEALTLVERAKAANEAELARLAERLEAIAAAAADRAERIAELRARVAEFEGEEAARQEAWEALNRRRDEVARRRDAARAERQEAAAALARLIERRKLWERRLGEIERELAAFDTLPEEADRIPALVAIEDRARRGLEIVRRHIDTLRTRQRDLRERAGAADRRLEEANRRRRELEKAIAAAKEASAKLAIEIAELKVRLEATAEALRRDADADEDQALAAPRPDIGDDDPRERLASREAELRRMGPINPLAAAEYEELAARVEMMEAQLADLEESRRELRKVIAALDEEMAKMFLDAFEEIGRYYEENFSLVFPGGRGRLRLTDPSKPLETGVEIEAQPLGKKIGRLSLLSGGERSLAALAFLFAVFRARPSPFYVLDEVEAALDDANLRRFLRLVDTLRESSQLVIITHQQQTMEAADILYGVTMEPGASSQVVAKRLQTAKV